MDNNEERGNLNQLAEETDDLLEKLDEVGRPNKMNAHKGTISPEMQKRLSAIRKLLEEGYTLDKILNAFPELRNNSGRSIVPNSVRNPAGFSWIAFFFPYAVCTQIREWSYFYVSGIIYFLTSIMSAIIKNDLSSVSNIAISLSYGIFFPYLRYIAIQKGVEEIPRGKSIIYGLLLGVVAVMPSLALDSILGVN
ncbi:MAG: hypothetical protein K9J75_05790 [Cyanobium usitatum Tobar12.5m-G36]|mgnify:CR=1 FL=1|jgi:hypothetical protein|nr:hypothetical protein [Cyanobium usitatum Tobar12.5m-G36]